MSMGEKIGSYKGHLYVLLAALFVLTIYCTLYLREDATEWARSNLDTLLRAPQESELEKLDHVLNNAAMPNRTVILVTLSEAWAKPNSIFDIFLESFQIGEQTQPLMKHLVIIAIDNEAMIRCKAMHLHCYLLNIDGMDPSGSEKRFMSKDYVTLIWERLHFFGKVLELGYNFLLTDVDIVWFRTPFNHLLPDDDIAVSCDQFTGNTFDPNNRANVGFIFVKSNNRTINFYNQWYQMRSQHPNQLTQAVFDNMKKSEYVKNLGLKIRYLDTAVFGGFCQHGNDLNKLRSLHANCCVGLDLKIYDLKIILDVWKNFSSLPIDRKLKGVPWRAPIKCRM